MLFKQVMPIYSEKHTKLINTSLRVIDCWNKCVCVYVCVCVQYEAFLATHFNEIFSGHHSCQMFEILRFQNCLCPYHQLIFKLLD
jgi:hypothetical protein